MCSSEAWNGGAASHEQTVILGPDRTVGATGRKAARLAWNSANAAYPRVASDIVSKKSVCRLEKADELFAHQRDGVLEDRDYP
jgi:hypothetical protein